MKEKVGWSKERNDYRRLCGQEDVEAAYKELQDFRREKTCSMVHTAPRRVMPVQIVYGSRQEGGEGIGG